MKKILTLLALLCMVCTGAWAQNLPFETSTSKEDANAKWYTLRFKNVNDYTYAYVNGNQATQLGQCASSTVFYPNNIDNYLFCFVQSGEGYHIYNKGTGKAVYVDNVSDASPVKVGENPTLIKYNYVDGEHYLYDAEFANPVQEWNTLAAWSNTHSYISISAAGKRTKFDGSKLIFSTITFTDYTLNISGDDDGQGRLIINGTEYADGATIKWPSKTAISTNYLRAKAVSGCLSDVTLNTSAKTITLTYTAGYDVTYNITATDANGNNQIEFSHTKRELLNATPSLELDYFTDIVVVNSHSVDADHTSFNVTATYNYPMMPGKFYHIRYVNGSNQWYLNREDDNNVNMKGAKENTPDNLWYVKSLGDGTFSLCNVANQKAVHGRSNQNNACEFIETFAYEFEKAGESTFRFYEPGTGYNLGAHGNYPANTANGGIGKWGSGRKNGTIYEATEFDEAIFNISNGMGEGYVGYIPNFANFASAKEAYTTDKSAANLKAVLAAYADLEERVPLTANKFYYIRHKGSIGTESAHYPNSWLTSELSTEPSGGENHMMLSHEENPEANCIFYYDDNNHLIAYRNGLYANANSTSMEAYSWTLAKQSDDYAYCLKNGENALTYWGHDGTAGQAAQNYTFMNNGTGDWAAWYLKEVESLPITIASSGFTTFYAPVDMQVSDNLTAYTAAVDEGNAHVTFTELTDRKIPAGTGVLLQGNPEDETPKTISVLNETVSTRTSDLKGAANTVSYALNDNTGYNAVVAGDTQNPVQWHAYTLQSGTWKRYSGTQLTGFKAHLELEDISALVGGTRAYSFDFGAPIVTGVYSVNGMVQPKQMYDLSGRQVNKAQRGLYIVNGNKLLR